MLNPENKPIWGNQSEAQKGFMAIFLPEKKDTLPPSPLSENREKLWQNENYKNIVIKALKKRQQDPDYHLKIQEVRRKRWQDPLYKNRVLTALKDRLSNPEYQRKINAVERARIRRKLEEKTMEIALGKYLESPLFQREVEEINRMRWTNPEYRNQVLEVIKQHQENPLYQRGLDKTMWHYAQDNNLLPEIIKSDLLTPKEMNTIQRFFTWKKVKAAPAPNLIDRFSLGLAQAA